MLRSEKRNLATAIRQSILPARWGFPYDWGVYRSDNARADGSPQMTWTRLDHIKSVNCEGFQVHVGRPRRIWDRVYGALFVRIQRRQAEDLGLVSDREIIVGFTAVPAHPVAVSTRAFRVNLLLMAKTL